MDRPLGILEGLLTWPSIGSCSRLEENGIAVETRTILTHEPARVHRYLQNREEARILVIERTDRWNRSPGRGGSLIGMGASRPRKPLLWLRGLYSPEHQVWMYDPRECGLDTAGPIGFALHRHANANPSICAGPLRYDSRTEALIQLLSWADQNELNATDQDVLVLPESSASLIQRLTVGAIKDPLFQKFPGAVVLTVEAGEALEAFSAPNAIASG